MGRTIFADLLCSVEGEAQGEGGQNLVVLCQGTSDGIAYTLFSGVSKDFHPSKIDRSVIYLQAKRYVLNAAHKQGMTQQSKVTALADGAANCWSVIASLTPHCQQIESTLDWFHIGKKFQTVKNALGDAFEAALERAKWKLWHGKVEEALSKLELLKSNVTDEKKRSKLNGLYKYINGNKAHIVNYDERKRANKTYTSQVA